MTLPCSEAPEGRDRRSVRLSADKAVELGIVRSVYLEEAARRRSRSVGLGDGASRAGGGERRSVLPDRRRCSLAREKLRELYPSIEP